MSPNDGVTGATNQDGNASSVMRDADAFTVEIDNIGGITHEKRSLPVGVTPLVGANATKRSSFLSGVMAGLGSTSDVITVNTAADEGRVELTVDGETFTRTVQQSSGSSEYEFSGSPVVEDPDAAEKLDLYAFLHGENEVRDVIESDGDVYDVLMRPVDTDEIEDRINEIKARKREINDELERIEDAKDELVTKENTISERESDRDELIKQLDELEGERDELEAELEAARDADEKSDAEQRLEEIEEAIDGLEEEKSDTEAEIEALEETISRIELELTELMGSDTKTKSIQGIEDEIGVIDDKIQDVNNSERRLREAKKEIDELFDAAKSLRDEHGSFKTVLEELSDESIPDGPVTFTPRDVDSFSDPIGDSDVTSGLIGADDEEADTSTSQCLVCGQETGEEQIKNVLEQYRIVREELQGRITSLNEEKRELNEQRDELQREKEQIRDDEEKRAELENRLDEKKENLDEKRDELDRVESELSEARSERDSISLSGDEYGGEKEEIERIQEALKQKREERRKVDRKLQSVEDDLERVESRREELEDRIGEEDELEAELEEIDAEHDELRGRVEQKETELVEQFNTHMETVIEVFGYTNLERVWIETKNDADTQVTSAKDTEFDVHIVRENGKESRLPHLSESERVVTGILFAVTGYVVHDVADICPVMILDSIEMIDGERVAALLAFLDEQAGSRWTIAALLPDHMTDVTDDVVTGTERFTETGDVTLQ